MFDHRRQSQGSAGVAHLAQALQGPPHTRGGTQLDPVFVGVSLAIGIVVHLLHHFRLKISKSNPYANGFSALSRVIPIIALITLFGYLPEQHQQWGKFAWGLQCLGFAAIGLFIVSIYESRAKRFED